MSYEFHCPKCKHNQVGMLSPITVSPSVGINFSPEPACFLCVKCHEKVPCGPNLLDLDKWVRDNQPKLAEVVAVYAFQCPRCFQRGYRGSAGPTACGDCGLKFNVVTMNKEKQC